MQAALHDLQLMQHQLQQYDHDLCYYHYRAHYQRRIGTSEATAVNGGAVLGRQSRRFINIFDSKRNSA